MRTQAHRATTMRGHREKPAKGLQANECVQLKPPPHPRPVGRVSAAPGRPAGCVCPEPLPCSASDPLAPAWGQDWICPSRIFPKFFPQDASSGAPRNVGRGGCRFWEAW